MKTNDPLMEELKNINYDNVPLFLRNHPRFIEVYNPLTIADSDKIKEIHEKMGGTLKSNIPIIYWSTGEYAYLVYHQGNFYYMAPPDTLNIDLSILDDI